MFVHKSLVTLVALVALATVGFLAGCTSSTGSPLGLTPVDSSLAAADVSTSSGYVSAVAINAADIPVSLIELFVPTLQAGQRVTVHVNVGGNLFFQGSEIVGISLDFRGQHAAEPIRDNTLVAKVVYDVNIPAIFLFLSNPSLLQLCPNSTLPNGYFPNHCSVAAALYDPATYAVTVDQ